MRTILLLLTIFLVPVADAWAQSCNSQGDPAVYGTNNVWLGYVYNNSNLTNYRGYVTEGNSSSLNFDQNFGGDDVDYNTNGCTVQTSTFSVRYRLNKTFTNGTYQFVVGGDDGYRLSFDGGATWAVNNWSDHSYATTTYTVALNGNYNMVLEYYENNGSNRISISMTSICVPTTDPSTYGTNNVWNGHVYDGTTFNTYIGMVSEGTSASPNFDESFGGSNVTYNTGSCSTQTETFSVRYRLRKTFANGNYLFTAGGDDGYRLSLDGGATWVIDRWVLQSYASTTTNAISLNGTYDMVLEYYENSGDNRVTFSYQVLSILPVTMEWFTASQTDGAVQLSWKVSDNSNPLSFDVQKSSNSNDFSTITSMSVNNANTYVYSYTDKNMNSTLNYYRLKITDQNGMVTYSKILSIRSAEIAATPVKVYPTVVTGNQFFLKTTNTIQNATIVIRDLNGKQVNTQSPGNIISGQELRVDVNSTAMAKGIYIVSIYDSKTQQAHTGRIVLQ